MNTKCYCGHTTTCDCGPEELKQVLGVDFEMSIDDDGMSIMIPITKQETLEKITEQIQNECHIFVESVTNVTYQDATNTFLFMKLADTFLFMKLAELTLKLKKYE